MSILDDLEDINYLITQILEEPEVRASESDKRLALALGALEEGLDHLQTLAPYPTDEEMFQDESFTDEW